jgi:hypothetical protein
MYFFERELIGSGLRCGISPPLLFHSLAVPPRSAFSL